MFVFFEAEGGIRDCCLSRGLGVVYRRQTYENELEEILRCGREAGQFAVPDTKIATLAIIAMLTGVNTWYRDGGRLDRTEVQAMYWGMVHRAGGA